jgi:mycofactocin precursor
LARDTYHVPMTATGIEVTSHRAPSASKDSLKPTTTERSPEESVNLVEGELLVEEISIDGMCGVY